MVLLFTQIIKMKRENEQSIDAADVSKYSITAMVIFSVSGINVLLKIESFMHSTSLDLCYVFFNYRTCNSENTKQRYF